LPAISESHYYALGRLLLAFTIFWAYVAFFQFMLIWIGNKPDEVTFYLARIRGPWAAVSVILVTGGFVLPFLFLLNYRLKRSGWWVAAIGAWTIFFHYGDIYWLVVPSAHPMGFPRSWLDLSAVLAVCGPTTAAALFGLRGRRLVPIGDPRLAEALGYESP
jgi:hypothetical protein